jgi:hypothetical protein
MVLVSKDHVGVNIGIQIFHAKEFHFILESRDTLTTLVVAATSSGVIGTITVDVHISVRSPPGGAIQKDSPIYIAAIAHVGGAFISIIKSFGK